MRARRQQGARAPARGQTHPAQKRGPPIGGQAAGAIRDPTVDQIKRGLVLEIDSVLAAAREVHATGAETRAVLKAEAVSRDALDDEILSFQAGVLGQFQSRRAARDAGVGQDGASASGQGHGRTGRVLKGGARQPDRGGSRRLQSRRPARESAVFERVRPRRQQGARAPARGQADPAQKRGPPVGGQAAGAVYDPRLGDSESGAAGDFDGGSAELEDAVAQEGPRAVSGADAARRSRQIHASRLELAAVESYALPVAREGDGRLRAAGDDQPAVDRQARPARIGLARGALGAARGAVMPALGVFRGDAGAGGHGESDAPRDHHIAEEADVPGPGLVGGEHAAGRARAGGRRRLLRARALPYPAQGGAQPDAQSLRGGFGSAQGRGQGARGGGRGGPKRGARRGLGCGPDGEQNAARGPGGQLSQTAANDK